MLRTDALQEVERRLFRKVIAVMNAKEVPRGQEDYWASVKRDTRNDFRELAWNGRLSNAAIEFAKKMFIEHSTVKPDVAIKDGHASISYVPKFKNFEASVAYVLLRLSAAKGVHYGVCAHCDDLWYDDRPGKGRKRESFCSDAHRRAFNQHMYRVELKLREKRATKHK